MSGSPLLTLRTSIKQRGGNLVASWHRQITFVSQLLLRGNDAILFHRDSDFFADKTATSQHRTASCESQWNFTARLKVIKVSRALEAPTEKPWAGARDREALFVDATKRYRVSFSISGNAA
jgi:hypothetical protein